MAKCSIFNEDGFALRNLNGNKFNSGNEKKEMIWNFSMKGVDLEKRIFSDAIKKALTQLEAAGHKNLSVRLLDENLDVPKDMAEKSIKVKKEKGIEAPTLEEAEAAFEQSAEDWEKDFFKDTLAICKKCSRNCKQSVKVTLLRCPQRNEEAA